MDASFDHQDEDEDDNKAIVNCDVFRPLGSCVIFKKKKLPSPCNLQLQLQ